MLLLGAPLRAADLKPATPEQTLNHHLVRSAKPASEQPKGNLV
ncbi:unnamed protein product, partial [marine sediment metagenome]